MRLILRVPSSAIVGIYMQKVYFRNEVTFLSDVFRSMPWSYLPGSKETWHGIHLCVMHFFKTSMILATSTCIYMLQNTSPYICLLNIDQWKANIHQMLQASVCYHHVDLVTVILTLVVCMTHSHKLNQGQKTHKFSVKDESCKSYFPKYYPPKYRLST